MNVRYMPNRADLIDHHLTFTNPAANMRAYCCKLTDVRFSLKALLAIIAAAALCLGYSQWRRQAIRQELELLATDGVQFTVPDSWVDRIWQRYPAEFVLHVQPIPTSDDNARVIRAREALKRIGAKNVRYMAPVMEWPK
jgi:hypothetical protein